MLDLKRYVLPSCTHMVDGRADALTTEVGTVHGCVPSWQEALRCGARRMRASPSLAGVVCGQADRHDALCAVGDRDRDTFLCPHITEDERANPTDIAERVVHAPYSLRDVVCKICRRGTRGLRRRRGGRSVRRVCR